MAAEPSMGVNPALLTLNPVEQDEVEPAPAGPEDATGADGEGSYTVAKLLDFCLHDNHGKAAQETWTDPKKRYEVRFLVSNTWEPREMFDEWPEQYDNNIADIEKADPSHPKLAAVEQQVKRLNKQWRKTEKEREREKRKGRKAKSAERKVKKEEDEGKERKGEGKGKSRARDVEVEKESKAANRAGIKPKRTRSSTSRAGSAASSSTLAGGSAGRPAPRTRRTRRSAADNDIDPEAWHEYLETNAPSDLRKLRRTPSPKRDENGRLVSPPSDSERGDSVDEHAAGSSIGLGIVGTGGEDVEMGEAALSPGRATPGPAEQVLAAPAAPEQHRPLIVAGGFAGSDDSEGGEDEVTSMPVSTSAPTASFGGFAQDDADSDDDDTAPYFLHLVPLAPSQSQQASPHPAQPQAAFGSASSSHDIKPDVTSHSADADDTMEPTSAGAGMLDVVSAHEVGATRYGGEGEGAPTATASPAVGTGGGFAGSGSSDEEALADVIAKAAQQPLAGAAADVEEEKPRVPAQRSSAPRVWAGDSSDDDDDMVVVDAPVPQAASVESAASAATTARPARPSGGFAGSSDEDDAMSPPPDAHVASAPPPPPQQQQQPSAASSRASSARAAEPGQFQDDGVPASVGTDYQLVDSDSSRRGSASRRRSPSVEGSSRSSTSSRPSKRARAREPGSDGSRHGARDMSPPSTTRAQQLKRIKIGRVGQKPPAPPPPPPPPASAPSPSTAIAMSPQLSPNLTGGADRAHPSAVSSETSSSGARARKILDPFNHGVKRAKSSGGYVILNGDLLRNKKLSMHLAPNEKYRYPPGVDSEIDKIRHLWGIRLPGVPVVGVYDFDNDMHLDGEPREVYITMPPDENLAGRDKSARAHLREYEALQLVLSGIEGVKQADSARDSVSAIFVHASELPKVGKFPDGLLALERYRKMENAVYFAYGAGEDGKRAMRPFWLPMTAFTFTPAAFNRDPARISALVEQAPRAFSSLGYRTQFPWIPAQYFLRGGAYGPAADVLRPGPRLPPQDKSARTVQLHSLACTGTLAVATVAPYSSRSRKWLGFPDPDDGLGYADKMWTSLDKTYPASQCFVDLERLQRIVCDWRSDYTQVRRWVVIATPEEMATCSAPEGIYVLPVAQAEAVLE
ncbi:hypothetical protein JCM8208_007459 [Rhodotorula glutinis]